MRHLVMNKPQCLLYSAAMVLDVDIEDITDILGHDGMDVIDPTIDSNDKYRGVHIQEIQTVAFRLGRHFYPVEVIPASLHNDTVRPIYNICGTEYAVRFMAMIKGKKGILIGQNTAGNEHAVAFDDMTAYDPIGKKYSIGCFQIREAWICS